MIAFNPIQHVYTNSVTGENYISVTTLLGKYKPKFDEHYHAERIAKRDGVTKEAVLKNWDVIRTTATDRGTAVHNLLENYIKDGTIHSKVPWLFSEFDRLISENTNNAKKMYSEELLYSHDYKVAGTSDIIINSGKYFHVVDFKTNKQFNYFSRFNEFFNAPVEHLSVCEFNTYCLQLSMYAYMYERNTSKKLKSMFVMFLQPSKKTFDVINMNYMKHEVEQIFENYKLNLQKHNQYNK